MEILYSGQARTLVVEKNGELILHRFGDKFTSPITVGELNYVFGSAEDVRVRQVGKLREALDLAEVCWKSTRAVINLSILLSGLPLGDKPKLFAPTANIIQSAVVELEKLLAEEDVYALTVSSVFLQYVFFRQNAGIILQLERLVSVMAPLPKNLIRPIERLAALTKRCARSLNLAKEAVRNSFKGDTVSVAATYRYLLKSDMMADLILAIATELRDLSKADEGIEPRRLQLKRDEIGRVLRHPTFGAYDDVVASADVFLEELEVLVEREIGRIENSGNSLEPQSTDLRKSGPSTGSYIRRFGAGGHSSRLGHRPR